MEFHHDSSAQLGRPLFEQYAESATPVLRHTANDKTLSTFVSYNNRFKVSCAMKIDLSGVSNIERQDTPLLCADDQDCRFMVQLRTSAKVGKGSISREKTAQDS